MLSSPLDKLIEDCYIDEDCTDLWKVEDERDHVYVKSRFGHLINFTGYPLQWSSKLQTQITLSTTRCG